MKTITVISLTLLLCAYYITSACADGNQCPLPIPKAKSYCPLAYHDIWGGVAGKPSNRLAWFSETVKQEKCYTPSGEMDVQYDTYFEYDEDHWDPSFVPYVRHRLISRDPMGNCVTVYDGREEVSRKVVLACYKKMQRFFNELISVCKDYDAPADVGTEKCGEVQEMAQAKASPPLDPAHPSWGFKPRLNKARSIVTPSLKKGEINEACAQCIMEPFLHDVPVVEQASCGLAGTNCFDVYAHQGEGIDFFSACEEMAGCDETCQYGYIPHCDICADIADEIECYHCYQFLVDFGCTNVCEDGA